MFLANDEKWFQHVGSSGAIENLNSEFLHS